MPSLGSPANQEKNTVKLSISENGWRSAHAIPSAVCL